jgi:PAS domain S-box-containing protein
MLFGELHLKLLEQYAPPSVVVNDAYDIVHLSEHAGRYLQFSGGEPTANLPKVIHPALRLELRTALFRAGQTKAAVNGSPVTVVSDAGTEIITLNVRPVQGDPLDQGFYLVTFAKIDDAAATIHALPPPAAAADGLAGDMQAEIESLKRQLAELSEQYDMSNEELKASNEELQAMNEEMRSATEELETSKEELQSVNEELVTVNNELKNNVEELSRSNADLNNLMASTDIGTIFLDRQLRIDRFTPSAQKIFNLISADVGRPISDITSRLSYDGLLTDAHKVLENLQPIEHEVQLNGGAWLMARIAPYRTTDDRIAGVVATFVDISARKRAEEALRASEARLRRTLEIDTVGVTFFTLAEGRVEHANSAYQRLSGYSADDVAEGLVRVDSTTPPEFMPVVQEAIEELKRTGKTSTYEKQCLRKDGSRWWVLFSAAKVDDELAVEFVVDITDRKDIEQALQSSEERLRTVTDHVPQLIWTNSAEGVANYFNRRFLNYTGLSPDELHGPGWQAVVHPDDGPRAIERWQQALPKGEVFEAEYRLRQHDGTYRWFLGRNVPLRKNGQVVSWFGTATDIHELKTAEAKLHETEEKFRLLVEGARDYAMFLLDLDNVITYWSSGAEKIFGWSRKEAEGQNGSLIFTEADKARGAVEFEIATAMQEGRAPDRRWHVRKDGSRVWIDGIMTRLDHPDGSPRGFAKITRDATDQREAEDALRHARDEMEQRVVERTGDLLETNRRLQAAMAERQQLEQELLEISEREKRRVGEDLHDMICQELTATALFLGSKAKVLEESTPAAADTLRDAAQVVNRNVGLARDLARGLQPAELGSIGLTAALRDLAAHVSANQGIKCRLRTPRTIRIKDEPVALNLYRIAQEAITNAVKHSGGTAIVICLERISGEIRLVVEDNGKGIGRTKKGHKGLGLHIMKYRANVLGGTVEIEPREKGGTKVICRVPVKR